MGWGWRGTELDSKMEGIQYRVTTRTNEHARTYRYRTHHSIRTNKINARVCVLHFCTSSHLYASQLRCIKSFSVSPGSIAHCIKFNSTHPFCFCFIFSCLPLSASFLVLTAVSLHPFLANPSSFFSRSFTSFCTTVPLQFLLHLLQSPVQHSHSTTPTVFVSPNAQSAIHDPPRTLYIDLTYLQFLISRHAEPNPLGYPCDDLFFHPVMSFSFFLPLPFRCVQLHPLHTTLPRSAEPHFSFQPSCRYTSLELAF